MTIRFSMLVTLICLVIMVSRIERALANHVTASATKRAPAAVQVRLTGYVTKSLVMTFDDNEQMRVTGGCFDHTVETIDGVEMHSVTACADAL